MDFITPKEAATLWGISERRVQVLCQEGKVEGVTKFAKTWAIPKDTIKPKDGRYKENKVKE